MKLEDMRIDSSKRPVSAWLAMAAASTLIVAGLTLSAHALSEIKPDDTPGATTAPEPSTIPTAPAEDGAIRSLPLPPPPGIPDQPRPATGEQPGTDEAPATPAETPAEPGTGEDLPAQDARPGIDPSEPIPEVIYDLSRLTAPARRMRELILEAAKTGDLEKLRPLLGMGDDATLLSLGGLEGDVIAYLKGMSGDGEGQEILAILSEVLEAGFVHLDPGQPEEVFVWPYFFALPIEGLTPSQRVELFRIVTAGDYEDMKNFGTYVFYRVGITPEGRWRFFVAGD